MAPGFSGSVSWRTTPDSCSLARPPPHHLLPPSLNPPAGVRGKEEGRLGRRHAASLDQSFIYFAASESRTTLLQLPMRPSATARPGVRQAPHDLKSLESPPSVRGRAKAGAGKYQTHQDHWLQHCCLIY